MKRKPMSRTQSKRSFRKGNGIHKMNKINPRKFRGGIRL